MQPQRYAAERRFRRSAWPRCCCRSLFLAFLLVTMARNGLGGFSRAEIGCRSTSAARSVARSAQLAGRMPRCRSQAPTCAARFERRGSRPSATRRADCSAEALASVARRDRAADPDVLIGTRDASGVPRREQGRHRRQGRGRRPAERAARRATARATACARRGVQHDFLDQRRLHRSAGGRHLGRAQGLAPDDAGDAAARLPGRRAGGASISRNCAAEPLDRPIEVTINNLAAVPSIIFGLLGLAVFLNFMHLPRSAPLVGGLTLALMTMPVIVIAGAQRDQGGAALDPRRGARRRRLARCRWCSTTSCRSRCPAS